MCPPGPRPPNSTCVCSAFSPPTKKLPCAFSTSGVSRCLNILERLRYRADGHAEDARKDDTDQNGRSANIRETLTSHVYLLSCNPRSLTARPAALSVPSVRARAACRQRAPAAPSCRPASRITALASGLNPAGLGSTRYSFVLPSVISIRPSARIEPPRTNGGC